MKAVCVRRVVKSMSTEVTKHKMKNKEMTCCERVTLAALFKTKNTRMDLPARPQSDRF